MKSEDSAKGDEKREKKRAKKSRAWLLDPEQVSEILGISRSTVIRMIADKQIPAIRLRSGERKKVWRVRKEALETWVHAKEQETMKSVRDRKGLLTAVEK